MTALHSSRARHSLPQGTGDYSMPCVPRLQQQQHNFEHSNTTTKAKGVRHWYSVHEKCLSQTLQKVTSHKIHALPFLPSSIYRWLPNPCRFIFLPTVMLLVVSTAKKASRYPNWLHMQYHRHKSLLAKKVRLKMCAMRVRERCAVKQLSSYFLHDYCLLIIAQRTR